MRKNLTFADGWRKRYLSRKLFGAKNPVLRLRLILIKKNIFDLSRKLFGAKWLGMKIGVINKRPWQAVNQCADIGVSI